MKKVFIDGSAGTTGLRILDRLSGREDICLLKLPEEKRKDTEARREIINEADLVFLCLPDAAAKEAVTLVENPNTVVLDASTAHRTEAGWAYGLPQLSPAHREKIATSKRIAVPGCHASGFISLVYPLIEAGVLSPEAPLSCFSLTGYSGGGKQMIAQYEDEGREACFDAPRIYALGQEHKHLKEMVHVTGIRSAPVFSPIVADFYSGMLVSVPLFAHQVKGGIEAVRQIYREKYQDNILHYVETLAPDGFAAANGLSGLDSMEVTVSGSADRFTLNARYDNLGKGASGAAIECMNVVMGVSPETGLSLK